MAAVIVPDQHHADVRDELRRHVAPGQHRWHFRDERNAARHRFIAKMAELAALDIESVTITCSAPTQRKVEQARVRAVWGQLAALKESQVRTLVIESRQDHNDRKDRREIMGAQRAGVASRSLTYCHARPKDEPLLWLPDALAGAIGMSIADNDHQLITMLPEPLRQISRVGH